MDDETAEELLEKIANGDISNGDFSDDESAEADLESTVSASLFLAFSFVKLSENVFIAGR